MRDIIDTADPVLHESRERLELAGGMPILFGAGSNATAWIAPSVAGSGVAAGRLVLLRFHGHGNQGSQVVGYGTTVHILFDVLRREPVPDLHSVGSREEVGITAEEDALMGLAASRSRISVASLDLPEVEVAMRQLRPLFAPCGSIELHGCRVGGGADGRRLLRKLADIVGVPVSAAIERQTTGNAIRFRPPILTVCPGGVSLRQWGTSQPVINRSLA